MFILFMSCGSWHPLSTKEWKRKQWKPGSQRIPPLHFETVLIALSTHCIEYSLHVTLVDHWVTIGWTVSAWYQHGSWGSLKLVTASFFTFSLVRVHSSVTFRNFSTTVMSPFWYLAFPKLTLPSWTNGSSLIITDEWIIIWIINILIKCGWSLPLHSTAAGRNHHTEALSFRVRSCPEATVYRRHYSSLCFVAVKWVALFSSQIFPLNNCED